MGNEDSTASKPSNDLVLVASIDLLARSVFSFARALLLGIMVVCVLVAFAGLMSLYALLSSLTADATKPSIVNSCNAVSMKVSPVILKGCVFEARSHSNAGCDPLPGARA